MEVARNRSALVSAAVAVLAERPEASMADIAAAAGVTRQTAYAHFGAREALLAAVRDELSRRALAVLDDARLAEGPAAEALDRFVAAVGTLLAEQTPFSRYGSDDAQADAERHVPVEARLAELIGRGRAEGAFVTDLDTDWLIAATIALGHAADREIRAGRRDPKSAAEQFRTSVTRLYGVVREPGRPARAGRRRAG